MIDILSRWDEEHLSEKKQLIQVLHLLVNKSGKNII